MENLVISDDAKRIEGLELLLSGLKVAPKISPFLPKVTFDVSVVDGYNISVTPRTNVAEYYASIDEPTFYSPRGIHVTSPDLLKTISIYYEAQAKNTGTDTN